jgi:hypothetical protein
LRRRDGSESKDRNDGDEDSGKVENGEREDEPCKRKIDSGAR